MNAQEKTAIIAELTEIEEDVRWGLIKEAIERLMRLQYKLVNEDEQRSIEQHRSIPS